MCVRHFELYHGSAPNNYRCILINYYTVNVKTRIALRRDHTKKIFPPKIWSFNPVMSCDRGLQFGRVCATSRTSLSTSDEERKDPLPLIRFLPGGNWRPIHRPECLHGTLKSPRREAFRGNKLALCVSLRSLLPQLTPSVDHRTPITRHPLG